VVDSIEVIKALDSLMSLEELVIKHFNDTSEMELAAQLAQDNINNWHLIRLSLVQQLDGTK
jgi:hypothetical protein